MKILLIHNYYRYPGGEDTYIESLEKLLTEHHHQVIKFSKNNGSIQTVAGKLKVVLGLFRMEALEKELTNLINNEKPDVAQIQNIYPQITPFVYRILKEHRIPTIQRVSNYRLICPKGTLYRNNKHCYECVASRLKLSSVIHGCYTNSRINSGIFALSQYYSQYLQLFKLVDHFFFPSEYVRDLHLKYFKIDKKATSVIHTFNNIKAPKPKPLVKDSNYFLYIGQFNAEKGVKELVETFRNLPSHRLLLIGDGPLRPWIKENLELNIQILPWQQRTKLVKYYINSKALIIPSNWHDPLPNVLIEALKMKKRIIVSDKLFITNPYLHKFRSIIGFSNISELQSIIASSSKSHHFSKQDTIEYEKQFSNKEHYDKLIKLYRQLIDKKT